jgi:hypothetical protein
MQAQQQPMMPDWATQANAAPAFPQGFPVDMSQFQQPAPMTTPVSPFDQQQVMPQPAPQPMPMDMTTQFMPQPAVSADMLNAQLRQVGNEPAQLQAKLDTMEQIAISGSANNETYNLLVQEAKKSTDGLSGAQLDDARFIRKSALWSLGMLVRRQNADDPSSELFGSYKNAMNTFRTILGDKKMAPEVQAAAIQALQVVNRPNDPEIRDILGDVAKKPFFLFTIFPFNLFMTKYDPAVVRMAQETLNGKSIQLSALQA